jgi:hypothetical protein
MNNWITPNEILSEIKEIGSYVGHFDSLSGTLEWYDKEREISIYATPNWETDGEVPFDVNRDDENGYHHICTIKMVKGEKSTQLTHYLNVLMMVMNHYSEFGKYEVTDVYSFKTLNLPSFGNGVVNETIKNSKGITQSILDFVEKNGNASFTKMNEFYKKSFGSNSFVHILKSLQIPYKNRLTKRYLIKVGRNYEVRLANPSNWIVKEY